MSIFLKKIWEPEFTTEQARSLRHYLGFTMTFFLFEQWLKRRLMPVFWRLNTAQNMWDFWKVCLWCLVAGSDYASRIWNYSGKCHLEQRKMAIYHHISMYFSIYRWFSHIFRAINHHYPPFFMGIYPMKLGIKTQRPKAPRRFFRRRSGGWQRAERAAVHGCQWAATAAVGSTLVSHRIWHRMIFMVVMDDFFMVILKNSH